jgi:hypothetical protein
MKPTLRFEFHDVEDPMGQGQQTEGFPAAPASPQGAGSTPRTRPPVTTNRISIGERGAPADRGVRVVRDKDAPWTG